MLELTIAGPSGEFRIITPLPPGETVAIGRGLECDLSVDWEPHLSSHHLTLTTDSQERVALESARDAHNPIFLGGNEITTAVLGDGDFFVVGETTFHLAQITPGSSPSDRPDTIETIRFEPGQLQQVPFRDPAKRLEVLTRLPELITDASTDEILYERLLSLLLAGIPHADAVAIVDCSAADSAGPHGNSPSVLHWDRRRETAGPVRPSRRLVREAIDDASASILHTWDADADANPYTVVNEFNWAYCTPVLGVPGERRALYVAGRMQADTPRGGRPTLESDVRYTELIAEIVGSLRRVNRLERQRSSFRQFFAPPVLAALGEDPDTALLEPRECDVTVMFCDLRDFSKHAETSSDDLIALLDRVSRVMGVVTTQIHKFGGVTGDFQGDAALGFWGWPFPANSATEDACLAALGIRAELARAASDADHPLSDFSLGIGLAHGRAVAGKIGTSDQVKVTVFGPVVNLASRLESLTRQLRVPILLDEATARRARERLNSSQARLRRLARVQPYGLDTPHTVSELLPPQADWPELTDEHITRFEQGVDRFIGGQWDEAYKCLHAMPATDRAQDFLMMLITQHNRIAPSDWDGIVTLPSK